MAYPPYYTTARRLLRQVRVATEHERAGSSGKRRALLDAVHARTQVALDSPMLLADQDYAEQVAAQARDDLEALARPGRPPAQTGADPR